MEANFDIPRRVEAIFGNLPMPWGVCGGWALDLSAGRVSRPHQDIEVAVLRKDQLAVQAWLRSRGWTAQQVQDGRFAPWADGEFLALPIHEIWCRHTTESPGLIELLLNESSGDLFRFRRDTRISIDLVSAFVQTPVGIPVLAPELVLLYKAKHALIGRDEGSKEKENQDFRNVIDHLSGSQQHWLGMALTMLHPDHHWLGSLPTGLT